MTDWRIPVPRPHIMDFSQGLGALDDALMYRREQEHKRKAAAEYKRQNDLGERRIGMQEQREQAEFELKNSDRESQANQKIAQLLEEGRDAEAAIVAKTTQFYDPRAGKMRGPRFTPAGPQQPGPAELDTENPYGGVAKLYRLNEPMSGGGQQQAHAEQPNDYAGLMKMMGVRPQRPQQMTKPRLDFADGTSQEFDPGEREAAQLKKAERMADRATELALSTEDPRERQVLLAEAKRIRAALPVASAAHIRNRESQIAGQEFKAGQDNKYQLTAEQKIELARRRLAKGAGKKPGDARADARLDLQTESAARMLAKDVVQASGFKEVQAQNRKFNGMAEALAAKPNAALDAVTAGSFVKMAQGGTGVVSDSDMEVFWERIGGVTERSAQWVANVMSGKINPEKRAAVAEAINALAKTARANLDSVRDSMEWQFSQSPNLSSYSDQFVGGYFASARDDINKRRRETAGGGKPPPDAAGVPPALARPGGPAPVAAPSPDKARYQAAIEKARAAGKMDLVKRLEAEMGGM